MTVLDGFDFSVLDDPTYLEDAVREDIIAPILKAIDKGAVGTTESVSQSRETRRRPLIFKTVTRTDRRPSSVQNPTRRRPGHRFPEHVTETNVSRNRPTSPPTIDSAQINKVLTSRDLQPVKVDVIVGSESPSGWSFRIGPVKPSASKSAQTSHGAVTKKAADLAWQGMSETPENFPPSVNRQREAFPNFSTRQILLGLSVGGSGVVDNRSGQVNREGGRAMNLVQQERTRGAVDGLWIGALEERQSVEGAPVREALA